MLARLRGGRLRRSRLGRRCAWLRHRRLGGGDRVAERDALLGHRQRLARIDQTPAELVVARRAGASDLSRFKYLLAEYSTPYNAGQRSRTVNLKMSAKLVNGEIVQPGQVFSTNLAIGPRNAANGWKEAKMFVSGQVVDGVGELDEVTARIKAALDSTSAASA